MVIILYLERSENELELAKIISRISDDTELRKDVFNLGSNFTFYSAVISHSYYSIFYAAKAYLMSKGIKIESPEEHRKTYDEFKSLVNEGILDVELLRIYEQVIIRADTLLEIFLIEKKKRGSFTYQKIAQANKDPAKNSLDNARIFFRNIYNLLD